MIFRSIDYNRDVAEIVELLKTSLSEKHSVSNFLWKHTENPFGESYGLLACEDGRIIGVRMFMFWEFRRKKEVVRAIRPVDTITHPDHRGRGIFKRLTLEGLQNIKDQYDIIFNTPNSNSFPGYVKLGWQKHQAPLRHFVSFILPSVKNSKLFVPSGKNDSNYQLSGISTSNFFKTHAKTEYLHWRFKSDEYFFATYREGGSSLLVIYRLKKIRGIPLLILVEYIGEEAFLQKALRGLAAKLKVFFVYHLDQKELSPLRKRSGESIVVFKDDKRRIHDKLCFSLADLEGRL